MKPTPERARPVYVVSEPVLGPADQVVAAITGPSVRLADLEVLLRRLLLTAPAAAPPPRPASTRMEAMLKCLLSTAPAQASAPRHATTDIETILQHLRTGTLVHVPLSRPATVRRYIGIRQCVFPVVNMPTV